MWGALFSVHEYIFGASLSKPHTSVTALHMRVCIYVWTDHLPEILNEQIQIFHYDLTKIDIVKQWRATVQVQRQEPTAMMTKLEARMALVCASTDDSRPLTGCTNLIWSVVNWVASGNGPSLTRVSLVRLVAGHA